MTILYGIPCTRSRYDQKRGLVAKQEYPYIQQLLSLQACTPSKAVTLPKAASEVCTPLHLPVWERELRNHPDQNFVTYITQGIAQGFCIRFNRSIVELRSCKHNLQSAEQNPAVVDEYLDNEVVLLKCLS